MSGTVNETATWWAQTHAEDGDVLVAYFSMEFGVDARLAIYSGGLGVLAGDHLKAAAELGVPLVAVGLFYRGGYFVQSVSVEGRQTERYEELDPEELGLTREPVDVEVDLGGEVVNAAVWRYDVGTVPLYLLDVPWVTDALYSGNREHRIRQELLLGVGGVRALHALGITPSVYHVNEGHSAFLDDRARARARRSRRVDGRRARPDSPLDGLHDAHAGARRQRGVRRRPRAPLRRRPRAQRRDLRRSPARPRADPRHRRLRPDTAGAASLGAPKRRLRAPRRRRTRDVARRSGRARRRRSTRSRTACTSAPGSRRSSPTCSARRAYDRRRRPDWANWPAARELDGDALWRTHESSKRRLIDTRRSIPSG